MIERREHQRAFKEETTMSTEESNAGSEQQNTGRAPDSEGVQGRSGRDVDETRRALIRAGRAIPAVLAVGLPANAFAQYAHSDAGHSDAGHSDVGHSDLGHTDTGFVDVGHTDLGHQDIITSHADHTDAGGLVHADHTDGV